MENGVPESARAPMMPGIRAAGHSACIDADALTVPPHTIIRTLVRHNVKAMLNVNLLHVFRGKLCHKLTFADKEDAWPESSRMGSCSTRRSTASGWPTSTRA